MGATRRLDHYDASMGWQSLFIVAGVGVMIIGAGIALQVLQFIVSIKDRNKNLDTTGDPWDGRTLEWSTTSPAPFYNFAHLPVVNDRDAFWVMKQQANSNQTSKTEPYNDIVLPKNTGFGVFIAAFAFLFGFSAIWHMPWLAILSVLGILVSLIIRSNDENTEYLVTASEVKKIEQTNKKAGRHA